MVLRRALLVLVLAASALMLTAPRPVWACSCAQIDPLESAELAFTGVVTAVSRSWGSDEVTVRFAVESVQKGVTDDDDIELTTHSQSPACGYPFTEGHRYRVFSDGTETTSCDGNEDLGFAATTPSKTPVAALWTTTAAVLTLAAAALLFRHRRRRS